MVTKLPTSEQERLMTEFAAVDVQVTDGNPGEKAMFDTLRMVAGRTQ